MKSIEFSNSGNVIYNIDTDNRIITAKIKCLPSEPMDIFYNQLTKHIMGTGICIVDSVDDDYLQYAAQPAIKGKYIGKAKCHPEDEFDIDYGKKLALLRAKEKYLNAMSKQLEVVRDWVIDLYGRAAIIHSKFASQYINCCLDLYDLERHL